MVEEEEKGFWDELGDGFTNSLSGVWSILKNVFSLSIVALPYLLLVGIVPAAVLLIIFRPGKKRKKADAQTDAP